MEKQSKNPITAELDDTALKEVAGGLNLGTAPVSGDISPDKQLEKCVFNKDRLNSGKTTKVVVKEIEKAEVAKTLREVTDKNKMVD